MTNPDGTNCRAIVGFGQKIESTTYPVPLLNALSARDTVQKVPFIAENDTFWDREIGNEALLTEVGDVLLWRDYGARFVFVREIGYWHNYLENWGLCLNLSLAGCTKPF